MVQIALRPWCVQEVEMAERHARPCTIQQVMSSHCRIDWCWRNVQELKEYPGPLCRDSSLWHIGVSKSIHWLSWRVGNFFCVENICGFSYFCVIQRSYTQKKQMGMILATCWPENRNLRWLKMWCEIWGLILKPCIDCSFFGVLHFRTGSVQPCSTSESLIQPRTQWWLSAADVSSNRVRYIAIEASLQRQTQEIELENNLSVLIL